MIYVTVVFLGLLTWGLLPVYLECTMACFYTHRSFGVEPVIYLNCRNNLLPISLTQRRADTLLKAPYKKRSNMLCSGIGLYKYTYTILAMGHVTRETSYLCDFLHVAPVTRGTSYSSYFLPMVSVTHILMRHKKILFCDACHQ